MTVSECRLSSSDNRPAVLSADGVSSENIVGYNTVTIKAGAYNMFCVHFQDLNDADGIGIQDLIPGTTTGLKGGNISTGDSIQVYDSSAGGYTQYYLQYVTFPPAAAVNNYKWMNAGGTVATYKFKNGDAFWYRSKGTADVTVTLAGGVSLASSQTIDIVSGYNMIGNAFPANFNPNSLGTTYWQNSGAVGGNISTGDSLQIYDPSAGGYTQYYLQYVTFPPAAAVNNWKWMTAGGTPLATDAEGVPVGKGAWYRHRGTGFTLTIPSPLSE